MYNRDTFAALGIDQAFVQDNHSLSAPAYTLRGLHFQTPPRGQDKLVRCIRGAIFDVAVDVRAPIWSRPSVHCAVSGALYTWPAMRGPEPGVQEPEAVSPAGG